MDHIRDFQNFTYLGWFSLNFVHGWSFKKGTTLVTYNLILDLHLPQNGPPPWPTNLNFYITWPIFTKFIQRWSFKFRKRGNIGYTEFLSWILIHLKFYISLNKSPPRGPAHRAEWVNIAAPEFHLRPPVAKSPSSLMSFCSLSYFPANHCCFSCVSFHSPVLPFPPALLSILRRDGSDVKFCTSADADADF